MCIRVPGLAGAQERGKPAPSPGTVLTGVSSAAKTPTGESQHLRTQQSLTPRVVTSLALASSVYRIFKR